MNEMRYPRRLFRRHPVCLYRRTVYARDPFRMVCRQQLFPEDLCGGSVNPVPLGGPVGMRR